MRHSIHGCSFVVGAFPAILIGMALVGLPSAHAWEADVHFGLTEWLAREVGFDKEKAKLIALGNQGVDQSLVTAPIHATILSACVAKDPSKNPDHAAGSVVVHDHHFPSEKNPPNSPDERAVVPGKVWRDRIGRPVPKLDDSSASYIDLGRYLHALQDSWSHKGVPDVPAFCNAELGWGHARRRGGWSCHLADLTYRWRLHGDVREMAKATYEVLSIALGKKADGWHKLERAIDDFAKAETKWQKDTWFSTGKIEDRRFLEIISLADCRADEKNCIPYSYSTLVDTWQRITSGPLPLSSIPKEFSALFESFLWAMVKQERARWWEEFVDRPLATLAITRALHVTTQCPQLYGILVDFYLGDAFSKARGAHQPLALCELATNLSEKELAISCAEAVRAANEALSKASSSRGPSLPALLDQLKDRAPFLYSAWSDPKNETHAAVARFPHLPADRLVLGAAMVNGRPRITSFIWVPRD